MTIGKLLELLSKKYPSAFIGISNQPSKAFPEVSCVTVCSGTPSAAGMSLNIITAQWERQL